MPLDAATRCDADPQSDDLSRRPASSVTTIPLDAWSVVFAHLHVSTIVPTFQALCDAGVFRDHGRLDHRDRLDIFWTLAPRVRAVPSDDAFDALPDALPYHESVATLVEMGVTSERATRTVADAGGSLAEAMHRLGWTD